jgi:hypothetical protein
MSTSLAMPATFSSRVTGALHFVQRNKPGAWVGGAEKGFFCRCAPSERQFGRPTNDHQIRLFPRCLLSAMPFIGPFRFFRVLIFFFIRESTDRCIRARREEGSMPLDLFELL